MGSAPFVGGGFGHFYSYAPTKLVPAPSMDGNPYKMPEVGPRNPRYSPTPGPKFMAQRCRFRVPGVPHRPLSLLSCLNHYLHMLSWHNVPGVPDRSLRDGDDAPAARARAPAFSRRPLHLRGVLQHRGHGAAAVTVYPLNVTVYTLWCGCLCAARLSAAWCRAACDRLELKVARQRQTAFKVARQRATAVPLKG